MCSTQIRSAQGILDSVPWRDILFVAGDFNARIGKTDANTEGLIGRHTIGDRCSNGERLLQLAKYNNLCLVYTQFEHKKHHLVTRRSNDGVTEALIDHFVVRRPWRSLCLDTSLQRCRYRLNKRLRSLSSHL
ncbi:craniofacial development protein 2-like [Artemia franciscana]